jgi:hypothetical protein
MTGDQADREAEQSLNIQAAENELRGYARAADDAIRAAGVVLNDLMHGNAWHGEYAEGLDGADAEHEIQVAWRAVRNLQRIIHKLSPEGDR